MLGILATTALLSGVVLPDAYGQRSGSSSSSPSSSSGFSRPSAPSAPSTPSFSRPSVPSSPPAASTPSFSRPPVAAAPSAPATTPPTSSGGWFSRPSAPPATAARPETPAAVPPAASSGGFSRPSVPTATTQTAPNPATVAPSSGGFSRPGVGTAVVGGAAVGVVGGAALGHAATTQPNTEQRAASEPAQRTNTTTQADRSGSAVTNAQQRSMSTDSYRAYQAERAAAQRPPTPVSTNEVRRDPVFTSARTTYGGDTDRYMRERQTNYSAYRRDNPQVFVITQDMRPNYGMYDSGFLTGMMLGSIGQQAQNAAWLAAQQNQPWYPAYRADLERQARDNAELRSRMAAMDAEMATLRQNGQVRPVTSLPAGIDASVALAPEAVIADSSGSGWGFWTWFFMIGFIMLAAFMAYVWLAAHGKIGRRKRLA